MFAQLLKGILAGALFVFSQLSTAQSSEQERGHKFDKAKQYYAECKHADGDQFEQIQPYLKAFTDVETMADTLADPLKFAKLMQVVSDPRTMHVMMKCSTEPVMWDTWMHGLTDFNKLSRAGMRLMNPAIYMNWMMAPMNPQMYAPFMQMMDPQHYTTWMTALMNPAFYQPMFAFADPNWYAPRVQWMANPRSMEPLSKMLIPQSQLRPGAPVEPATASQEIAEKSGAGAESAIPSTTNKTQTR